MADIIDPKYWNRAVLGRATATDSNGACFIGLGGQKFCFTGIQSQTVYEVIIPLLEMLLVISFAMIR